MNIDNKHKEIEKKLYENSDILTEYISDDIEQDKEFEKMFINSTEKEREEALNKKKEEHYNIMCDFIKKNISYDDLIDQYYYSSVQKMSSIVKEKMLRSLRDDLDNYLNDRFFGNEGDKD